jgi:hypothetical protein
MDETGVNHAIEGGGSTPQAVQIIKIAPMDLGTSGGKRPGGRIGAGEADHLMARFDEFRNDGRADETCSTSDEYTHGNPPSIGHAHDVGDCLRLGHLRGAVTLLRPMWRIRPSRRRSASTVTCSAMEPSSGPWPDPHTRKLTMSSASSARLRRLSWTAAIRSRGETAGCHVPRHVIDG